MTQRELDGPEFKGVGGRSLNLKVSRCSAIRMYTKHRANEPWDFIPPPTKQEHHPATMSVHADPPPAIVTEPHGINYATSNQLGKGGFAICFKAERLENDKPTGHLVALKIVKSKMEPAKLAQKVYGHCRSFRLDNPLSDHV